MSKPNPFFSIIIPTLNEEKYLPQLLLDLASQTYSDFEVIIVDGHSKDKTVEKAKSVASSLPSLKVLSSSKRHVSVQRNLGAKKARANTLIFMDADNRLPSYFLQGIKYRLESTPADMYTTWIKPDGTNSIAKMTAFFINLGHELQEQTVSNPIALESMLIISKNIFRQVNGFDETVHIGEGRYLSERVIRAGGIYRILRDPIYTYSLRRVRSYGALRTGIGVVQTEIMELLGIHISRNSKIKKIYPMLGGDVYEQDKAVKFADLITAKLKTARTKNKLIQSLSKIYQEIVSD